MQIPDLLKDIEGFSLFVQKMSHKREKADNEQGDGLFAWTLDLIIDFGEDVIVESVPYYLEGALAGLQRAREGKATGRWYCKPLTDERKVTITLRDPTKTGTDDEIVINRAPAEIRLIEIIATPKSSRFRLKLLIPGLMSTSSGELLEADKCSITLDSVAIQRILEEAA